MWADEIVRSAMNVTADDAQAVRTKIDGLKWVLAKLHPEKWGDRVMNVHSGEIKVETIKDHAPEWLQEKLTKPASPPTATTAGDETEVPENTTRH